jgi:hypothetical protein
MARRTALSSLFRIVQLAVVVLAFALTSCGGNKGWSCAWQCTAPNMSSGTATYPDGPDPTNQCAVDHGGGCTSFSCDCNQG